MLRTRQFFTRLTWKRASRHNGHPRIRKQDKRDSETGMSADSKTVIRKLGQYDSETGPARIRKQDKHDSETGMSADSETVIRKLGQT